MENFNNYIVNLSYLKSNFKQIKKLVGKNVKVCAMVKANAYGHGAVPVSSELQQLGISSFCVATISEGIELRRSGIQGEILILGSIQIQLHLDNTRQCPFGYH